MKIGEIQYVHEPLLAPTDAMLKAYKKEKSTGGFTRVASSPLWPTGGSRNI